MLSISGLTYRIGGRTLFEDATAQLAAGQKVGLVGRNGTGKSTLLALIRGELQPDGGEIAMPKGARLGHVAQEAPGGEVTPLQSVLAADAERSSLLVEAEHASDPARIAEIQARLLDLDAHAAPARAAAILAGLGFDAEAQQRPLASFSGGWRVRVALAGALFAEPDLLLLDEPTNHLDLEAALWLESYLKRWRGTLLLVSHDRQILNSVSTHILHLENRRLTLYGGNYDNFVRTRRERLEHMAALAAQQEKQRRHLQAFIDRFRAKATKARQAQSRVKALARLETIATPVEDPSISFDFPQPEPLSPPIVALDDAAVGYAAGRPVLRRLGLRLDPEDRIALLGANGNGKSTLARLIAGRLEPMEGRVTRAGKLRVGFFGQHQIEELRPERTPYDHMAELMPQANEQTVRGRLGRFGFGQEKAFVRVDDLSGGEKARLTFALIAQDAPHLLILDEPTNHLDIEAREALVEALADYAGAVLLISHDWHLLELAADRLWLVAEETARPFDGDLDDYRAYLLQQRPAEGATLEKRPETGTRRDDRRAAAEKRAALQPLRRRARDAEERAQKLAREKAEIDRLLADPATYREGGERVPELMRRQGELARLLAAAEEAWLDAEAALEEAAASS
jgi:ATP-binding cassette, subfamily F, member 3